jgi:hypothetical protein
LVVKSDFSAEVCGSAQIALNQYQRMADSPRIRSELLIFKRDVVRNTNIFALTRNQVEGCTMHQVNPELE